jgi:hypothetical protein
MINDTLVTCTFIPIVQSAMSRQDSEIPIVEASTTPPTISNTTELSIPFDTEIPVIPVIVSEATNQSKQVRPIDVVTEKLVGSFPTGVEQEHEPVEKITFQLELLDITSDLQMIALDTVQSPSRKQIECDWESTTVESSESQEWDFVDDFSDYVCK